MLRRIIDCVKNFIKGIVKKQFLTAMIALYVIVVVLFATVNWAIFFNNSTAFLISDQLNKHVERYDFLQPDIDLASYHRNAKDSMPITISDFSNMIRPDLEKLQSANDSLKMKKDALEKCTVQWDSLSRVASEMRNDSVNKVRRELLSGYQEKIDSLQRYLDGKDTTKMIIEGKYVELAQLQYEYAKKNAEVVAMFSRYIGNFIPDSLSHQIRKCNEDYLQLTFDIQEVEGERRNITSKIRQSTVDFHNNRLESVSWLDFLYYSICVSTTVSFGDIAPNNGCTRFVAILELLMCLLIVGYIVDRIIKKKGWR
jgi:hypothetical protein